MLPRKNLFLSLLTLLASTLVAAPAHTVQPLDAPDQSTPAAAQALADVQALLGDDGTGTARRAVPADPTREATLLIRRLRLHQDDLSPDDQAAARTALLRPAGDRKRCYTTVCVHWSTAGDDASSRAYVDQVATVTQRVLSSYAAAGYRAPKPDGRRGGHGRLDIYLENLGTQGMYGYCNSDSAPPAEGPYDVAAFCVLDNDYTEFPAHTPKQNLQVTAAHELFHAVQFAYDYFEDGWFMEATATWAEDELYDGVDDNVQYLQQSPLTQPRASMDHFGGVRQYGDWIFFRYLTERFPAARGGLPTLVRDMWRRADGAKGGADDYSIKAVRNVLAARDAGLPTVFAEFADANRRPATAYDEGRANRYPQAPLAGRVTLSGNQRNSGQLSRSVDHLASATIRFSRDSGLRARKLRLALDLPPAARGSAAVATTYRASSEPTSRTLRLSTEGDAVTKVAFGRDVTRVEVTLANAGTRYRCWRPTDTGYSCRGRSRDDDRRLLVQARALR